MIESDALIKQLTIGQIQIKKSGQTKFTSCVKWRDCFSLVPTHLVSDINNKTDCIFLQKGDRSQTTAQTRPKRILKWAMSQLAILIFDNQDNCIDLLEKLQIKICKEQQSRAAIYEDREIRLHGYHIQNRIINRSATFISSRKTICCQYSLIAKDIIHYTTDQNNDGFIGSAISMQEERWIGVHQGGRNNHYYGILFTKNIIQKLISMVTNSYPRISVPPVADHILHFHISEKQELKNQQQFYESIEKMLEHLQIIKIITKAHKKV